MNDETTQILTQPPAAPRRSRKSAKIPLTHRMSAKFVAFLLAMVLPLVTLGCVMAAWWMIDDGIYGRAEGEYRDDVLEDRASSDCWTMVVNAESGVPNETFCRSRNIHAVEIKHADGTLIYAFAGEGTKAGGSYTFYYTLTSRGTVDCFGRDYQLTRVKEEGRPLHSITLTLSEPLTKQDTYRLVADVVHLGFAMRYWVYFIGVAATLLWLVCYVFLLTASGHHAGKDTVEAGWGTKLPTDLLLAGCIGVLALLFLFLADFSGSFPDLVGVALCGVVAELMFYGLSMSIALRIKLGTLLSNTLCMKLLRPLFRWLKRLLRGLHSGIRQLPLVWKTALVLAIGTVVEFFAIIYALNSYGSEDMMMLLWGIKKYVVVLVVLYLALSLRKLQKGAEALAGGDLTHTVEERGLIGDLRIAAHDLNSIGAGMNAAVEQRMRSERMKTELITNVSHDIKTPLTSIINYADLIGREQCDNPTIQDYAATLHSQSVRLKRLIEDLVEASKASTGNLEVDLVPCEADILLTQAAGEFEQRLADAGLELVLRQPDESISIMADSRRLWRVFDNLLNNICKYAQSGTRVYLSARREGGDAVLTFKNTSRAPLDISPDELLERFVRGDSSRHTEGSGLGLSIAKSLTELQGGSLTLEVDGDLFKAVLRFPINA